MNTVNLIGNLTAEPQLSTTPNGHSVCEFSIAVTDKKKKGDEWVDEVSFFDCVSWGRQGEVIAQHHEKGDAIGITAKLKQERWEDKETGKTRSKIKLVVQSFSFAKGRKQSNDAPRPSYPEAEAPF